MNSSTTNSADRSVSPHNIRAAKVVAKLIKTLGQLDGPSPLRVIAAKAGMSPSRTHRYLGSLVNEGLVVQDVRTGTYDLGPTMIELGLGALGRIDAVRIGADALVRITDHTGLDSHLNVWGSNGPTVVKWEQGRLGYSVRIREGRNLPLIRSATGRVFLAYMPITETQPFVNRELAAINAEGGPSSAMDMDDVEALRVEVLRHGLARSVGEFSRGIAALSAPVFDHDAKLSMSITILAVNVTFSTDYHGLPAMRLQEVAREFTERLGGHMPAPWT